jgi:hypothetical protein
MLCPVQASLLLEAESFAGRIQGGAESWSEQMETLLTEELDGRLRAHRPRGGRIEEEVSNEQPHTGMHVCAASLYTATGVKWLSQLKP